MCVVVDGVVEFWCVVGWSVVVVGELVVDDVVVGDGEFLFVVVVGCCYVYVLLGVVVDGVVYVDLGGWDVGFELDCGSCVVDVDVLVVVCGVGCVE